MNIKNKCSRDDLYIIAEMSANHLKDIDRAKKIIDEAKNVGADAIKIQAYKPETMTINVDVERYQFWGTIWEGKKPYELYEEAHLPWEWIGGLYDYAKSKEIDFISSVYDQSSVNYLERIGVEIYKIASFELIDIPLLKAVAATKKRVILSCGMATYAEIEEAVDVLRGAGCPDITLLKCTTAYPARIEDANIHTIPHMIKSFGVPVGVSDHTLDNAVVAAGISLGASVVEKHFTLSRADGGPDSAFSLEPAEFSAMVQLARKVCSSLGEVTYGANGAEEISKKYRRSLFAVKDLKKGDIITHESVRSLRPSLGLHPRYLEQIIGTPVAEDIEYGTPITWDKLRT